MTTVLSDPVFTAHSDPIGAQKNPLSFGLADGGFLLFWQVGTTLMGRYFGADGQAQSGDLTLATGVTTYVAALGHDGELRLVLASGGFGNWRMDMLVLAENGTPGPITTLISGLTGAPTPPKLLRIGDGFQLAWSEQDQGTAQIHSLALTGDGLPLGPAQSVDASPAQPQSALGLTPTADGGFIAVWETTNGPTQDTMGRRFDAHGIPLGPSFMLNPSLPGLQTTPAITELANGDLLAVWRDVGPLTTMLWAIRLSPDGQHTSEAFLVDAAPIATQVPRIIPLSDGGYAILWEKADGDYGDLYIRRFDAMDQPMGEAVSLHIPDAAQQRQLSLSLLADGRLLASWMQGTTQNSDILACILDLRLTEVSGSDTLTGQQNTTQLMTAGASLTVAVDAVLTTTNQHGVQSTTAAGAAVTVAGEIRVQGDFGDFAAIRLMGEDGGNWVNVAETGVVRAAQGPAICLGGDLNTVTNAGLIEGRSAALIGAEGRDSVINNGILRGDVWLMGGNDTLDCRLGLVDGRVMGGAGNDLYLVGAKGLTLVETAGGGFDWVQSLRSMAIPTQVERLDLLGSANLWATGNAQSNTLQGNAGANRLTGLAGNDSLLGGNGNDRLTGGSGVDLLTGGQGQDRFVFASKADSRLTAPDLITDFRSGQDKIDLSALTGPKLAFFGTAAFDAEQPGVRLIKSQGWRIEVDLNGDGRADLALQLNGSKAPILTDFIL